MFDVPQQKAQSREWKGEVPIDAQDWNVGLIVGPSGSGKTLIAKQLFGEIEPHLSWDGKGVIDCFDVNHGIQEIADICQAVGFNTVPAWLRPFSVLSNGEKFRVDLARRLLQEADPIVIDEFTSVIDRQVAKIGSHAVQKYARRRDRRVVAVSCHYDIIEWLQPDWIVEMPLVSFTRRLLQRRPALQVDIQRVEYAAWEIFAPFHYMSAELHKAARCFALFVEGQMASFAGALFRPHAKVNDIYGISRLVTLPDYQGLGLAFVLVDTLGAAFKALGYRLHTYPAHPNLIRAFDRSSAWRMTRPPGIVGTSHSKKSQLPRMGGRPCAVFEYVGPKMENKEAANNLLLIAEKKTRTIDAAAGLHRRQNKLSKCRG
jgi:ABC-type iron transport system FetAB ATPase subunit